MKHLFAQISKVDAEKRLVYGIAAAEVADRSGEILDYETSKAHFADWVKETLEASDGQSHGNLRAMHGKVAAGKLTGIEFDDANKQFPVVAKVVDDQEWKKVLEGVYTGFSIGGSYVKKWDDTAEKADGTKLVRYTAKPNELSLVDRPCIPSAKFFEVQKSDGSIEKVEFKAGPGDEDEDDDESEDGQLKETEKVEYQVDGSEQDIQALAKVMHEQKLNVAQVVELVAKACAEPDKDDEAKKKAAAAEGGEGEEKPPAQGEGGEGAPPAKEEPPADKADDAEELKKRDAENLEKVVLEAVTKATESLQKVVTEQADRIKKLEALPLQPKGVLKAVSKAADSLSGSETQGPEPVVKDGQVNDTATEIKKLHQSGGKPLAWGPGGPNIN